jgi:8-amino-7-oxononanoate synthase
MKLAGKLSDKLQKRKDENAFRVLTDFESKKDFFSNDYLGLARIEFENHGSLGSTGSRLLSGNTDYAVRLENKLASFYNQDAGLFFNSGFDANLGVFSAIPQRGDTIIYDELCHASIRDGIRLSNANAYSFKHNDPEHLLQRLSNTTGDIYVVIESIYSMDGDESPLERIAEICKGANVFLIVDEAHSGGIYGKEGNGLVSQYNLDESIFIKLITFGKAYGSHGGLVLCSNETRDFLINFSRAFIYTTALPEHSLKRIEQVVDLSKIMDDMRTNLFTLVKYFKEVASQKGIKLIESNSPIQCVLVPGNNNAKSLEKDLQQKGFALKAILSPTVKEGQERIRICLHGFNMKNEVDDLLLSISNNLNK